MPGQIDFGGGSGPTGGIAEYQELDLSCGGPVHDANGNPIRICIQTDCGIAEFTDIDWPPGTIVGPEYALQVFVGDCCPTGTGSGSGPSCGTVITACCPDGLPTSFDVSLAVITLGGPGSCNCLSGTYHVTWDGVRWKTPPTTICTLANSLVIVQCIAGVLHVFVVNGATGNVWIDIPMTITNCCPLTASGSLTLDESSPDRMCGTGGEITATINDSTTSGTSPTAYVVYYRDLLIPEQFVRLGSKFCVLNPIDCCPQPIILPGQGVNFRCCVYDKTYPGEIFVTFIYPKCDTFNGVSAPAPGSLTGGFPPLIYAVQPTFFCTSSAAANSGYLVKHVTRGGSPASNCVLNFGFFICEQTNPLPPIGKLACTILVQIGEIQDKTGDAFPSCVYMWEAHGGIDFLINCTDDLNGMEFDIPITTVTDNTGAFGLPGVCCAPLPTVGDIIHIMISD